MSENIILDMPCDEIDIQHVEIDSRETSRQGLFREGYSTVLANVGVIPQINLVFSYNVIPEFICQTPTHIGRKSEVILSELVLIRRNV